jgi:sugar O-acyltransferase (sialic acid O-acetyltransferase NeuD family)
MARLISKSVCLAIYGAGGHAREIAWLARLNGLLSSEIVFIVDDQYFQDERVDSINVFPISSVLTHVASLSFVIGLGSPSCKRKIADRLSELNARFTNIVAPNALAGLDCQLGKGVILFPNVVVSVGTRIGNHVHLNTNVSVSHDCLIGECTTVSPAASICGHVQIGSGCFIGAGSTIINGSRNSTLRIGQNAVIGAGACVISSIADHVTVVGVPAHPLETSRNA